MRIGIDARFLTHPQLGGFKTYTVNLISALSKVDQENQYIIYIDRQDHRELLPQVDNFTYRVAPAFIPFIGMPIREQVLLRRIIGKDKLDIIHFLCNTATISLPIKFVLSLHDIIQVTSPKKLTSINGLRNLKEWAINSYSKWTILHTIYSAQRVITPSHYEKDQIVRRLNIPDEKVNVTLLAPTSVYAPIPLQEKEALRNELKTRINLPDRFILGVGYETRKNIPLLIEAFSLISLCHPDINVVIVAAEENSRQFFIGLCDKLNLSDRVMVLPAVKPCDLAVLYNLAEVFVFPSERESFGLPPLEALACGTPTIALNQCSLPEILEDGALLVDGMDVQTWANAIDRVISDQDFRSKLVERGLKQAAKMSWQRCAQETVQVYREVLDGNEV